MAGPPAGAAHVRVDQQDAARPSGLARLLGRRRSGHHRSPQAARTAADPAGGRFRVGVVAGPVESAIVRRRLWGIPTLAGTAGIAACVTAGRAFAGDLDNGALLTGLFGPMLLTAVLYGTHRLVVDAPSRTGGIRSAMAAAPLAVRRFRVQPRSGPSWESVLEGEPQGGELRTGDIVRVRGRRTRSGYLVAREVEILATLDGPVVRVAVARPARTFEVTRWLSRLGVGLAAATGLGTLLLAAGLFG